MPLSLSPARGHRAGRNRCVQNPRSERGQPSFSDPVTRGKQISKNICRDGHWSRIAIEEKKVFYDKNNGLS